MMPSSMEGLALPARILASSWATLFSDLFIWSRASSRYISISSIVSFFMMVVSQARGSLSTDQCSGFFTLQHFQKISFLVHVKHNDRQFVFHAQRESRHIHNIEILFVRLLKRQRLIPHGIGEFLRVLGINAIDARSFQDHIGLNLDRT